MSPRQARAFSTFNNSYGVFSQYSEEWNKTIFKLYADLFDDLIFGGSLKNHVDYKLEGNSNEEEGNHQWVNGRSTITVYQKCEGKDLSKWSQIGTLLHEQCHAFLGVYMLREEKKQLGRDYHGYYFLQIASAIQDAIYYGDYLCLRGDVDMALKRFGIAKNIAKYYR